MQNRRAVIMVVLALLSGIAAVAIAYRWLHLKAAPAAKMVVAAADINPGQMLNPQLLKVVDWPASNQLPGSFSDLSKLDGRVLKTSLVRGEPIIENKLAPAGTKGGLSALIDKGKRAITVRVNDVVGVAGFALPGSYVDVIVNMQKEGGATGKGETVSKIVLEKILVLAVAQDMNRDETKPRVVNAVTLEVTPEQAEKIDLARSVGSLSLALRNQVDPEPGQTSGATRLTLFNETPQPVPAAVVKPVAARPVPAKPAADPPARTCIGVMNGLRGTQECF